MHIGIDASCWLNRRGFGRYTRELVRALLAADRRSAYSLFLDTETARRSEDLPDPARAQRIVVPTSRAAARAASASGHRALRDLWRMRRAVAAFGPDLDVFFFPSVYTFFPVRTPAKVIVGLHDTTAERYPELLFPTWRGRLFWRAKVGLALRRADLVVTVSESAKQDLRREFGLAEDEVWVVPDAVDATFQRIEDRARIRRTLARFSLEDRRFVLYVGGISPHKNLETLITAFARLDGRGPLGDVTLVLIGDVEEDVFYSSYPAVRRLVTALGLQDRIIFTGFVPDDDLMCFYSAAAALVLPSLSEGFGLPAVEAMACGTPVAASRAGALPEVVGDAGVFFDPRTPDDISESLRRLLVDDGLRRELGQRGMRRARQYSWANSAQAALAAFAHVAG